MRTPEVLSACVIFLAVAASGAGCRRAEALPDLGTLPSFSLQDQAGRAVSAESLKGKPFIAAFMFTRCPTVCPRITRRMQELQSQASERELDVRFVSISVDPEHDTPAVLAAYAKQYGAKLESWSFLTGDYEVIRRTAEQGFKLGLDGRADAGAEHFGITHGSHLVLVDRDAKIRGYFRSSEDAEMKRLLESVEGLTK